VSEKRTFFCTKQGRESAAAYILREADEGDKVTVTPKKRTDDQNARFHWLCGLAAKAGLEWAGKKRTASQWKVLYVSAHATATREGSEMIPGLEGEFVNIRESTALMSVARGTSLIEYTQADLTNRGVTIPERPLDGYYDTVPHRTKEAA